VRPSSSSAGSLILPTLIRSAKDGGGRDDMAATRLICARRGAKRFPKPRLGGLSLEPPGTGSAGTPRFSRRCR
jgi:hypothetical protein